MPTENLKLEYFFDPFCGWCYASAPAVKALAETYPEALTMRPSGLFANTGGRPIASMAEHSWGTGKRIAAVSGQTYQTAYRDRVLTNNPGGIFDSIHPTRAMVALGEIDHKLEQKLLHELQTARYVEGKDTGRPEVVAPVAVVVAGREGHQIDLAAFAGRLVGDRELANKTDVIMRETVQAMRALSGSGVPQLLVIAGDHREVIDGGDLYGGAAVVLKAVDEVKMRAATFVR